MKEEKLDTRGGSKKGKEPEIDVAEELGDGKKLRMKPKWRDKIHNISFTTNGYEARLIRAHKNDSVAKACVLGGETKAKWRPTQHSVINPNSTKFGSGVLGKQGFDEFHPNKKKKLKLDDYSGVRSIDPGHNNFPTVFEATTAQVRAILANNVPPNCIQDKIQTWERKSDSPAERAECMFWDMAGHRSRHLTGQSNLSKRLTQFWARDPVLKGYMDGRPTLKTHQLHEILAATRYMSSRMHSVMERVLCSFVAKMTFRKNNRERSFWDALVARLMKPMGGSTKPPLIMFGNAEALSDSDDSDGSKRQGGGRGKGGKSSSHKAQKAQRWVPKPPGQRA
ncbi:hypothetical protein GGF32_008374 [Allomyces javanicus]|nr:hypothetical protein GGF32_008374 [Allomyces javanicus]